MFNPNTKISEEKVWNLLGTFYSYMDPDSKTMIETYWKALFNGLEGLYYNLSQNVLSSNLYYSRGFQEHSFEEYIIDFSECEKEYLDSPINVTGEPQVEISESENRFIYTVTAVNDFGETIAEEKVVVHECGADLTTNYITVSWDSVTGATKYRVYGRGTSLGFMLETSNLTFQDNGTLSPDVNIKPPNVNTAITSYTYTIPDNFYYLTIPELLEKNTDTVLTEDSDYEIINLRKIEFTNPEPDWTTKIFLNKQGVSVSPILLNVYLKAFGALNNPEKILENGYYTPYVEGWATGVLTKKEKKIAWTQHFIKWVNAIIIRLQKGPTIKNLKEALDLFYNVPFSYEAGEILNYQNSGGYHLFTIGDINYEIPEALTMLKTSGTVEKFELLCLGTTLDDYVTNLSRINTVTGDDDKKKYFALSIETPTELEGLNYYQAMIDYFKTSVIPPGVTVYEYTDTDTDTDLSLNLVFSVNSEGFDNSTKLLTPLVTPSETPTMERNIGSRYPELDTVTLNGYPIIEMYDPGAAGQAFVLPSDFDIPFSSDVLFIWSAYNNFGAEYALAFPLDLRIDAANTIYRLIIHAPPNIFDKDSIRYYYTDSEGVKQSEEFFNLGPEYDLREFHMLALHISEGVTKVYIDGDLVGQGAIHFSDNHFVRSSTDLGRQTFMQHAGNGIVKWVVGKIWTKGSSITTNEINERANEIATKYGLTWNNLS